MSQRHSGYARKERDLYETPAWATLAVVPHLHGPTLIWEPAAGGGKMVAALEGAGLRVVQSDIATGTDFLRSSECHDAVDAIVTNPPYEMAREFVEHALKLMDPCRGMVAMLLRTDFDHAKTRRHLFADCPAFARKVVLTKRIRWFEGSTGSPSFNHAWYIWDHGNACSPTLSYDLQSYQPFTHRRN